MRLQKSSKFNFLQYRDQIIIGLLLLGIFLNLINFGSSEKSFVLTNGKELEAPELDMFCISFINQILKKNLQKDMVEPDIYDILVQDNYQVLKLVGSETALFSRVKDDQCAVIVKDKLGLRRFDIWVNKSFSYPFYYRAQKIDEPGLEG